MLILAGLLPSDFSRRCIFSFFRCCVCAVWRADWSSFLFHTQEEGEQRVHARVTRRTGRARIISNSAPVASLCSRSDHLSLTCAATGLRKHKPGSIASALRELAAAAAAAVA